MSTKELQLHFRLKNTGRDNNPARFLKDGASSFKIPIFHIVNLYVTSSTVPIHC